MSRALEEGNVEPSIKRPNFSGIWELDFKKSSIQLPAQLPPPKSATCVIDHKEPHWVFERTHVWEGIEEKDVLKIELDIGAKPVLLDHGSFKSKVRMYWENETLILDSEIILPNETATNVVRYTLKDNGKTFIAEEVFKSKSHNHNNRYVFYKEKSK